MPNPIETIETLLASDAVTEDAKAGLRLVLGLLRADDERQERELARAPDVNDMAAKIAADFDEKRPPSFLDACRRIAMSVEFPLSPAAQVGDYDAEGIRKVAERALADNADLDPGAILRGAKAAPHLAQWVLKLIDADLGGIPIAFIRDLADACRRAELDPAGLEVADWFRPGRTTVSDPLGQRTLSAVVSAELPDGVNPADHVVKARRKELTPEQVEEIVTRHLRKGLDA